MLCECISVGSCNSEGRCACTDEWRGLRCRDGQFTQSIMQVYACMFKSLAEIQQSVTPCVPMEGLVLVLECAAALPAMEGRDAWNVS